MKLLYKNVLMYKYFILNIENDNILDEINNKYKNYNNEISKIVFNLMINDENYKKSLLINKNTNFSKEKKSYNVIFKSKKNIINDLILLFIFFGNDFLPKIPTITLNELEINLFLFYYCSGIIKLIFDKGIQTNLNNYYFSKKINYEPLLYILKELRNIEINYINNSIPIVKSQNVSYIKYDKKNFNINDYLVKTINPLKIKIINNDNNYKYYEEIPEDV